MKDIIQKQREEFVKIGEKDNQGKDEAWCYWYKCPKCEYSMIMYGQKFCAGCGGKLKWTCRRAQ